MKLSPPSGRRRRTVLVAGATVLCLVGAVALATTAGVGPFGYPVHPVPLVEASVDDSGRLLTVVGEYGCDEFASVEVAESATDVKVTVRMRHTEHACALVGNRGALTVRLDSPLGDRAVRDGGYGQGVSQVPEDLRQGRPLAGAPRPFANP